MPTCNDQINKDNEDLAPDGVVYGGVRVLVTAVNTNTITFTAYGVTGTKSGCQAQWGDTSSMWPACPSSLPSQATATAPGSPPAVGAYGTLYLSAGYLASNGIVAAPPKWPKALSGTPYKKLKIWPTSVVVTGVELSTGDMTEATIDLLDPRLAQAGQGFWLGDHPIEVLATYLAFAQFGVEFEVFSDLWSKLSAAVVDIESQALDPSKLVDAWGIIAACMERLDIDRAQGVVTDAHLYELRKVLPNHPALAITS